MMLSRCCSRDCVRVCGGTVVRVERQSFSIQMRTEYRAPTTTTTTMHQTIVGFIERLCVCMFRYVYWMHNILYVIRCFSLWNEFNIRYVILFFYIIYRNVSDCWFLEFYNIL